MQYKTIILGLIQRHQELYNRLRKNRILLTTLEAYARKLKTSHQTWKRRLSKATPGRSQSQTASEALEIALNELENLLHSESPLKPIEPPSIEEAMAFIRHHFPLP